MKIIQLIEPKEDILAVYVNEYNAGFYSEIDYLVLTNDGIICGCSLDIEGNYTIVNDDQEFVGLCRPSEIDEFLKFHKIDYAVCD